ncbi:hypothetical protein MMC30_000772 [Trapelia coarctata]|nr:hypothetical protein [Trapelia coarctata]
MAFTEEYEPFALIGTATASPHETYGDYKNSYGSPLSDTDVQLASALRSQYPGHTLAVVPVPICDLLGYAGAGNATAALDTVSENVYILRELEGGETESSRSTVTDKLIKAVGEWRFNDAQIIWVYDFGWIPDRRLWEEVQKAKWGDIILDERIKKTLQGLIGKFFDSMIPLNYRKDVWKLTIGKGKDVYGDLGVPWKRGVIFHGPPGNGKTITLKAIMHTLSVRKAPIPTLYVKTAPYTWNIQAIFQKARQMAPCLFVLEDIDTIVTEMTRSYFFNEVDGLEPNDGILMIASTNHLERLDPGLSHRPSRFDRKYFFPLPDLSERTLYCNYWRQKIQSRTDRQEANSGAGKPQIDFPEKLCPAMAAKMDHFSFAYMKEAFVATLLTLAERTDDDVEEGEESEGKDGEKEGLGGSEEKETEMDGDDGDEFDKYEIWRVFVEQVKILREDVDDGTQLSKLEPRAAAGMDANGSIDAEGRGSLSGRDGAWGGLGAELGSLPLRKYGLKGEMSGGAGLVPGENCVLLRS